MVFVDEVGDDDDDDDARQVPHLYVGMNGEREKSGRCPFLFGVFETRRTGKSRPTLTGGVTEWV